MAFAGLGAFDKNFCRLMSNQPINSITDIPKAVWRSLQTATYDRIMGSKALLEKNPSLRPKVTTDGDIESHELSNSQMLKSMFYKSSTGDLSYKRVGAAATAGLATTGIAGSYIFGSDD